MGRPPSPITLENIAKFNSMLAEVVEAEPSIRRLPDESWLPKFYRRTGLPLSWSWAYCLKFSEVLALALHSLGIQDEFLAHARSEQPYHALQEFVENFDPQPKTDRRYRRRVAAVLPLLNAMIYSIRAVGYHSQSIDELVIRGLCGEPVMLRNAVAVDSTVLSCPLVADHIARLQLHGEKKELALLYRAAASGPRKKLQPYWQLRYIERVLAEANAIELYGRESIYELVTERLKLYDTRGADPYKALFMSFDRWRKDATT